MNRMTSIGIVLMFWVLLLLIVGAHQIPSPKAEVVAVILEATAGIATILVLVGSAGRRSGQ